MATAMTMVCAKRCSCSLPLARSLTCTWRTTEESASTAVSQVAVSSHHDDGGYGDEAYDESYDEGYDESYDEGHYEEPAAAAPAAVAAAPAAPAAAAEAYDEGGTLLVLLSSAVQLTDDLSLSRARVYHLSLVIRLRRGPLRGGWYVPISLSLIHSFVYSFIHSLSLSLYLDC